MGAKEDKDAGLVRGEATVKELENVSDVMLIDELSRRVHVNSQLLEEVRAMNTELLEVNKKLEESEALKSHFISNITNEIINPFTSILGLSRAILTVDKEAWKKVISMVALIHTEAFSLDFQFRNIFFAAQLEAGQCHPETLRVDVRAVVDTVIDSFKFELQKRKIHIDVKDSLPNAGSEYLFSSDASFIKLVLANLLNNAVNFTLEGDKIEVRLGLDAAKRLVIEVQDWGIGIADECKDSVFDRCTRGNSSINSLNRGHGGGLSVCKALVDMLDGELSFESTLGSGSTFRMAIPESAERPGGVAVEANEIFFDDGAAETF